MATIRDILNKFTATILDTDLSVIAQSFVRFIIIPVICFSAFAFIILEYRDYKRVQKCEAQGVSEFYCDRFLDSGGD